MEDWLRKHQDRGTSNREVKKDSRLSEARKEAVVVNEGRKAVLIKLAGNRIGSSFFLCRRRPGIRKRSRHYTFGREAEIQFQAKVISNRNGPTTATPKTRSRGGHFLSEIKRLLYDWTTSFLEAKLSYSQNEGRGKQSDSLGRGRACN